MQMDTMPFPQLQGMPVAMFVILAAVGVIIGLGINAIVCYFLYDALRKLPASFRLQEPALVWLLMIPCFNIIWNFFVFPKISDSYGNYFASVGRTDVGDAGRGIGIAYCILAVVGGVLGLVPCVGGLLGLAALVLLIIYLVKITGLKHEIAQQPPMPPSVPPTV